MDASGLVSGLVLAAALLVLSYVNLADYLARSPSERPAPLTVLSISRLAAMVAAVSSGVTLFASFSWSSWPIVALLVMGLMGLLASIREVTRSVARYHPSTVRRLVAPLLAVTSVGSKPGNGYGKNGFEGLENGAAVAESVQAVITPEAQATLDDRERSMIHSILQLDQFNARDIMVPRVDITAVELGDDFSEVAQRMLESGHSRLPVYRETMDTVVGIVHSRDLLSLLNSEEPRPPVDRIMRKPFFVPETKRLDEMLTEFQRTRLHMALVVDEHGGIEGLVTLEDLLEEIVGEIEDEFSTMPDSKIVRTEDGSLLVDARVSLNDLGEYVPHSFEGAEVDTVGGLVYSELGKMPQAGDEVEYDGLRIKVLSTVGRRLGRLQVAPRPSPH